MGLWRLRKSIHASFHMCVVTPGRRSITFMCVKNTGFWYEVWSSNEWLAARSGVKTCIVCAF
jgi:hypothetical protein